MSHFLISEAVLSCFFMVGWYKKYRLWLTNNFPEQLEISTSPSALCIQLVDHSPCHKFEESQPAEPFTDLSRDNSPLLNTSTACRLMLRLGLSQHRLELYVLDFVDLQLRLENIMLTDFIFNYQWNTQFALQWLYIYTYIFSLLIFWLSVLHVPLSQQLTPQLKGGMVRYESYRSKVVQQARCSLLERYLKIWVFPKIGVPQNGWFIMENSIKMDDLGKTHYFWKHPYITNLQLKLNFVRSFFGGNIPPNSMTQRKILRMCLEKPTSILISLMWPDPMRVIFFWQPEDFRGKNWSLKIIKLLEDWAIWWYLKMFHPEYICSSWVPSWSTCFSLLGGSIYSWWEIATYSRKTQVILSMVFSFAQGLWVHMKDWNTRFSLGDVIPLDQWSNPYRIGIFMPMFVELKKG